MRTLSFAHNAVAHIVQVFAHFLSYALVYCAHLKLRIFNLRTLFILRFYCIFYCVTHYKTLRTLKHLKLHLNGLRNESQAEGLPSGMDPKRNGYQAEWLPSPLFTKEPIRIVNKHWLAVALLLMCETRDGSSAPNRSRLAVALPLLVRAASRAASAAFPVRRHLCKSIPKPPTRLKIRGRPRVRHPAVGVFVCRAGGPVAAGPVEWATLDA